MEDILRTDLWINTYGDIYRPPVSLFNLESSLKTPGLVPIARLFAWNAHRAFLVPASTFAFWNFGKSFAEAKLGITVPIDNQPDPELTNIVISKMLSQIPPAMVPIVVEVNGHIELLMTTQLVSTWTAFETLFGDLWKAALNFHPINLSAMKGSNKDSYRKLRNDLVEKEKFDLRNSMGNVLSANFKFSSLDEIREAYEAAFHDQGTSVKDTINDKSISAANAIRNVIVHKAGVCDDTYKREAEKLMGLIPILKIGERLKIDGELFSKISLPALTTSIQLIKSVDAWIEGHPAYTLSSECHEWTI